MKLILNYKMFLFFSILVSGCCCDKRKCKDGVFQYGTLEIVPSFTVFAEYPGRSCTIPTGGFGDPCSNTGNNYFETTTWLPNSYTLMVQISTGCPNYVNGLSSLYSSSLYQVQNDRCENFSVVTFAVNVASPNCIPSVPVPVFEGGSFNVSVLYYEDCISASCESPATNCGNNSNGDPQTSNRPTYTWGADVNIQKNLAGGLVTNYSVAAMLMYDKTSCFGNCQ